MAKHWPGMFHSFASYDSAVKLRHRLDKWNLWEATHAYMEEHCEYTDPGLTGKTNAVLHVISDVTQVMSNVPGIPHMDLSFQLLKNCVPTNDSIPWLIRSRMDAKKVQCFLVEMAGSKQFTPSLKPAGKRARATSGAGPEKETRKVKGSKAKAPAKTPPPRKEEFPAVQHLEGEEWATTLADDIGAAIDYTLRNVKAEHVDSTKVSVAMQWAVEFALLGQVTVPTDLKSPKESSYPSGQQVLQQSTVTLRTWTRVRRMMKAFLHEAHKHVQGPPPEGDEADPDLKQDEIGGVEENQQAEDDSAQDELADRAQHLGTSKLETLLVSGSSNTLDVSPAVARQLQVLRKTNRFLADIISDLWQQVSATFLHELKVNTDPCALLFATIGDILWAKFLVEAVRCAMLIYTQGTEQKATSLEALLQNYSASVKQPILSIWSSLAQVEHVLQLRTVFAVAMLQDVVDIIKMECPNQADQAWYRKVVGELSFIVKFVQASFADVAVFDSERDTKDEWVKGWTKIAHKSQELTQRMFTRKTDSEWKRIREDYIINKGNTAFLFLKTEARDKYKEATVQIDCMSKDGLVEWLADKQLNDMKEAESSLEVSWDEIAKSWAEECLDGNAGDPAETLASASDDKNNHMSAFQAIDTVFHDLLLNTSGVATHVPFRWDCPPHGAHHFMCGLILHTLREFVTKSTFLCDVSGLQVVQKKALKPGMGVRDMKFEIHCDFKATFSVPMLGQVVVMSKDVLDVEGVKTSYVLGVVPRLPGEAPDVVTNVFVMLPPDSERARFCYDMVWDLREPPAKQLRTRVQKIEPGLPSAIMVPHEVHVPLVNCSMCPSEPMMVKMMCLVPNKVFVDVVVVKPAAAKESKEKEGPTLHVLTRAKLVVETRFVERRGRPQKRRTATTEKEEDETDDIQLLDPASLKKLCQHVLR